MDVLLDFTRPLDVSLLDECVNSMVSADGKQNKPIEELLVAFQNHQMAWTRVDSILEKSQNPRTRVIALNILEQTVKYKWHALPAVQRDGIKNFIVNLIIKLSSDPDTLKREQVFLKKLNLVLVAVVKQDWPQNWPNFIPELVNSSKSSQSLCANNMQILLLLSEEIFDYGSGQMTGERVRLLKSSLNQQFTLIYQLCEYILDKSRDATLVSSTLQTLLRFLHWIPVGFIFETSLIPTLCVKFFPLAQFQNDSLACLSEIGGLKLAAEEDQKYGKQFVQLFFAVIQQVQKLIGPDVDVAQVYHKGNVGIQMFVRHLALFITSFLKAHLNLLEQTDDGTREALMASLHILLRISKVDDVTIFKICLEYWNILVVELYENSKLQSNQNRGLFLSPGMAFGGGGMNQTPLMNPRLKLYLRLLSDLRVVMIGRMAKPEEILIVEDEAGQIVREQTQDTDALTIYKSMRECLIYLTHLDPVDAQETMLNKLIRQVDDSEYSWHNLNTLCWAIGSISGALGDQQEKTFLVKVIKDLLQLCELKRGKDHKAVIASNIMYVVGQYPRFLRQHWKFLKTVVNKLFEFMHESHPGVQDMSVETFLKIARRCRKKFVMQQPSETRPFIEEICEQMPITIRDLEPQQIRVFYEACGEIIGSESEPNKRQMLIAKLMELPNLSWTSIITQANANPESLWDPKTVKQITLVLQTNSRVAIALKHVYLPQLAKIYVDMLQVYKMYSGYVSAKVAKEANATGTAEVRQMRAVKKEMLNLIRIFISNSSDSDRDAVLMKFIPALLDPVLEDYKRNSPDARESEVLFLFAEIVNRVGASIINSSQIAEIFFSKLFDCVFQCTLDMITRNLQDFPDHRIQFFRLLQAINSHSFPALLRLNPVQFQLIIDAMVWAMKHLERNIADTGLQILFDLLGNVANSEVANQFYGKYYISLLSDLLGLLTDTFHKPGFRIQTMILAQLFSIINENKIAVPLWNSPNNPLPGQFNSNQAFVSQFTITLLSKTFPNLSHQRVEQFAMGLFQLHHNLTLFKNHVRDFLVEMKEFSQAGAQQPTDANPDLFLEETAKAAAEAAESERNKIAAVPGLMYRDKSAEFQDPDDDDYIENENNNDDDGYDF